jgi:hypothetical protein
MGDWLEWSNAWKALTIGATALGTLKSWRNQWAGPKGLYAFCDSHIRPEMEVARLRYRNGQLARDLAYMTKQVQTKDEQLAQRDRNMDELIERINEVTSLSDFLDSSHDANSPKGLPTQINPPHDPSMTTTSRTSPRLRKRKPNSTVPPAP